MDLIEDDENSWPMEVEEALLSGASPLQVYLAGEGRPLPPPLRAYLWARVLLPEAPPPAPRARPATHHLAARQEALVRAHRDQHPQCECGDACAALLRPLAALPVADGTALAMHRRLAQAWAPRGEAPLAALRLLLQYHDPELSSWLETARVSPDAYAARWLRCLWAADCAHDVLPPLWDALLSHQRPHLALFLALILVLNARESLLRAQAPAAALSDVPRALRPDDVRDLLALALHYEARTPPLHEAPLAGAAPPWLRDALCLSLNAAELLAGRLHFLVVDCRPAEHFRAGHMPSAFHLDCELMLQEPEALASAVRGLLEAQRQAPAAPEHLCLVGSGRASDEGLAHMVAAAFLKHRARRLSVLSGGFAALHARGASRLEEHDSARCVECAGGAPAQRLLGRLSSAVRAKGHEVRERLRARAAPNDWHVSAGDVGRRYRDVPSVFGPERPAPPPTSEEPPPALEPQGEVVARFEGHEVLPDGRMERCTLLLTEGELALAGGGGDARYALGSLAKITAKKRHPQLVTFRFGARGARRLLLPEAGAASRLAAALALRHLQPDEPTSPHR